MNTDGIAATSELPLGGLVEELRRSGFPIGTDHHLRLQAVLAAMGAEFRGPVELGDSLCAIFATSREEQETFQRVYGQWWARAKVTGLAAEATAIAGSAPVAEREWWWKQWVYWVAAAVVAVSYTHLTLPTNREV